jgi:acetyltransferase
MAKPPAGVRVEPLPATAFAVAEGDLTTLLQACVHGGTSIGFLAPLSDADARAYWQSLVPQVASGARLVLVARDDAGDIVASGQLVFESRQNGRHRAEVCKVMVRPSHRRRGIAAELMRDLEQYARDRAIRLLFLDTSEGRGGARELYETLGYTYAGGIPDYALDPDGRPAKNAIFFKKLDETVTSSD